MSLGVWQPEAAAERVAELVVQPRADLGEAAAREPGTEEEVGSCVEAVRLQPEDAQAVGEGRQ